MREGLESGVVGEGRVTSCVQLDATIGFVFESVLNAIQSWTILRDLDNSQISIEFVWKRVFVFDNVLLNEPSRVGPHAESSEPCYIAWLIAASHSHLSSLNAASASTVGTARR